MNAISSTLRSALWLLGVAALTARAEAQLTSTQLNHSATSAATATQRVRSQVQQRVQAQVQQQVQAQVQQRIQAQTQQRIQSQARLRLPAANSIRINAGAGANARVDAGTRAEVGAGSRGAEGEQSAGGSVGGGIPVSVTAEEMANLDVVFGDFNPFRRRDEEQQSPEEETPEKREKTSVAKASRGQRPESSDDSAESERPRHARPIQLVFRSEAELQASLTAAVRQRRAEISAMRDRALAEANARMMAQADRLESMMETYVAAEAKANANVNSAIKTNPINGRGNSAIIQTGAEAEGQSEAEFSRQNRNSQP